MSQQTNHKSTIENRQSKIFAVADLCMDLLITGDVTPRFHQVEQLVDDYSLELGGSATIFGSQFAKLGGSVGLIGAVGDDAFGRAIFTTLAEFGVDVQRIRCDADLKTGLGLHLVKPDSDRATLTYSGTIDAVSPTDLPDSLLTDCRHWHLASYFLLTRLREHWPGWLQRCKSAGLTTSLDTNWDPEERWRGVLELLPLIDLFLPNEAEALAIAGGSDVDHAGERLSAYGPLVVIKQGEKGATAYKDGRRWRLKQADDSAPLQIVDTVGAGDNFDAGFLRAWLLGRDVEACLQLADRCARASLEFAGGVRGQLKEKVE